VNYLLDTNACIALINGKPPSARIRFAKAVDAGSTVFVPAAALFELWYGVFKSSRPQMNMERLEAFLAGPVSLLHFAGLDARTAGELRATLEKAGRPIGAYDLLIAGQALQHNLALVTANLKEFGRVQGLVWEDWGKTS
jgi:tRNA(fMet)-specific endonuclease VapC